MSYTDQTLVYDAYEKLKALNPQASPSLIPRLRTMIPSALSQFALMIADSNQAELLRATFITTAVDGVAPLTTAVTAPEPLLINATMEVFLTGSTHPLERVPDRETLQIESSEDFGFYCIEGLNILVREANEDYAAYDGTVTIIGSRVPTSATVPVQIEGELLAVLVNSLIPKAA